MRHDPYGPKSCHEWAFPGKNERSDAHECLYVEGFKSYTTVDSGIIARLRVFFRCQRCRGLSCSSTVVLNPSSYSPSTSFPNGSPWNITLITSKYVYRHCNFQDGVMPHRIVGRLPYTRIGDVIPRFIMNSKLRRIPSGD